MSKYEEPIIKILKKDEIMSTNEVLTELQNKAKKVINWHALYRVLMDLHHLGRIERIKAKAGFFWRKRY